MPPAFAEFRLGVFIMFWEILLPGPDNTNLRESGTFSTRVRQSIHLSTVLALVGGVDAD